VISVGDVGPEVYDYMISNHEHRGKVEAALAAALSACPQGCNKAQWRVWSLAMSVLGVAACSTGEPWKGWLVGERCMVIFSCMAGGNGDLKRAYEWVDGPSV